MSTDDDLPEDMEAKMNKLPRGTACNDPQAKYTVDVMSDVYGYGIYGYYTSQFDANRVAVYLKKTGDCKVVAVTSYDPFAKAKPGIHPMVEAYMKGY